MEQNQSPLEIMLEIMASLYTPLPEPSEGATWVGKNPGEMTSDEIRQSVAFKRLVLVIIANRSVIEPGPEHPRFAEYQQAKQAYESGFSLAPKDLSQEYTI